MKNISKLLIISILGILLFNISCNKEDYKTYFEDSNFVPDSEYPDIPTYSELGYNTFGVMIDRQALCSDNSNIPLKIIVKNDTTTFVFSTSKFYNSNSEYIYNDFEISTLKFIFPGYSPTNYKNLECFTNLNVNLKSNTNNCIVTFNDEIIEIINGNFKINTIKKMYLDNNYSKTIIAGVFDFQTYSNELPIYFHNGRYDITVGSYNFYNLD